MNRILVVDDRPYIWRRMFKILRLRGYDAVWCDTVTTAEKMIDELQPKLVLLNLCQAQANAWAFFHKLRQLWPGLRILTYAPGDMDAGNSLSKAVDEVVGNEINLQYKRENKGSGRRLT